MSGTCTLALRARVGPLQPGRPAKLGMPRWDLQQPGTPCVCCACAIGMQSSGVWRTRPARACGVGPSGSVLSPSGP
eukprot:9116679-Lingulodinium_polyedra.AAC.1